jgi:hypothetical protein
VTSFMSLWAGFLAYPYTFVYIFVIQSRCLQVYTLLFKYKPFHKGFLTLLIHIYMNIIGSGDKLQHPMSLWAGFLAYPFTWMFLDGGNEYDKLSNPFLFNKVWILFCICNLFQFVIYTLAGFLRFFYCKIGSFINFFIY